MDTNTNLDLAEVFVLLADSLAAEHDVVDTMDVLVQASVKYTSATAAGILLADEGGVLHVVASTNERTADVEEAQLGFDEGPCLDCFQSGEPVETPDLTLVSGRWPRFVSVATASGYKAAHASPLRLREQTVGAMNLFSSTVGPLSDQDAALALAFAQVATISLVQQREIRRHATLSDQLQAALESRVVIEQAKGVLAQRHGVAVDAAFSLLRNHARKNNFRLRDLSDRVVNDGFVV